MIQNDPHGKDQHEAGAKLDDGKLRADLVLSDFSMALEAVCEVGTFGANKYTPHGWKTVPEGLQRYSDAMMRHWLALKRGEKYDPESHLLHLAHFAWNALAILQIQLSTPIPFTEEETSGHLDYIHNGLPSEPRDSEFNSLDRGGPVELAEMDMAGENN